DSEATLVGWPFLLPMPLRHPPALRLRLWVQLSFSCGLAAGGQISRAVLPRSHARRLLAPGGARREAPCLACGFKRPTRQPDACAASPRRNYGRQDEVS